MRYEEVPVLIVGGSLVGLSTSLFLARHGVEHLVVERHPGTAIHPRAAFLMQRTVECYRGAGIEADVIEAARREFVQNGAIVAVESLAGRELQYFFRNVNDGVEALSPSPRRRIAAAISSATDMPGVNSGMSRSGSTLRFADDSIGPFTGKLSR